MLTDEQRAMVLGVRRMAWKIATSAVRRYFPSRDRNLDCIEEAAQEAMLGACRAAIHWRLDGGASFSSYAYLSMIRSVYHGIRRWGGMSLNIGPRSNLRSHLPNIILLHPRDERLEEDDGGKADVLSRLSSEWFDHPLLERLLASIPDRWKAIVLKRAKGETLEGIGTDMGISKERVRQLEEKALARLKRACEGDEYARPE